MILAAGVSTGVGISKAKLIGSKEGSVQFSCRNCIEDELERLDYCIKSTSNELRNLSEGLSNSTGGSAAVTLGRYIGVINNDNLIEDIKSMIRERGVSAEYAIASLMDSSKRVVEGLDDEYLNEKAEDIDEIKYRLLNKLSGFLSRMPSDISEECIVVADDFTPGDVLRMNPLFVKGIVTITGGPSSSSSIMARYMNIPAVMGVGYEGYFIKEGDLLIVDGSRGKVIINPDCRELQSYSGRV